MSQHIRVTAGVLSPFPIPHLLFFNTPFAFLLNLLDRLPFCRLFPTCFFALHNT